MLGKIKRRPNFSKIGKTQTYTFKTAAKALGRSPATIRSWVAQGMPTLNDGHRPIMIDGGEMYEWLKERWDKKKQKCAEDECFCVKCRKPRKPKPGSITFSNTNTETVQFKANCTICGSIMCQRMSCARMLEIKKDLDRFTLEGLDLTGIAQPSVSLHLRGNN